MEQVDTIRLEHQLGDGRWHWRAASGRTGRTRFDPLGLQAGDELVVGLRWHRARWQITRYLRIPDHAWFPAPEPQAPPLVTLAGSTPVRGRSPAVQPGDVWRAWAAIDPRSSAERDAGRNAKIRPVVVSWVEPDGGHAGLHFVYDVDSAVRREGLGRRLTGWREAGLRKPSVVSAEEHVGRVESLSGFLGRLSAADQAALGIGRRHPRPGAR